MSQRRGDLTEGPVESMEWWVRCPEKERLDGLDPLVSCPLRIETGVVREVIGFLREPRSPSKGHPVGWGALS